MKAAGRAMSYNLWLIGTVRGYRRFVRNLEDPQKAQERYLLELVQRNEKTGFGLENDFRNIASVEDYRARIPVREYADFEDHIKAMITGKTGFLISDRLEFIQPTSGTESPTKLVPYTRTLRAEFQRGIDPWIYSLYRRMPSLKKGRAYWALTPPREVPDQSASQKKGFDEDHQYLGFMGRNLFNLVSAVPTSVKSVGDVDRFLDATLLYLLAADDLTLVSVWSPTFLTILLDRLKRDKHSILDRLRIFDRGKYAARAAELENISFDTDAPGIFESVWKKLALISCWSDGPSESYCRALKQRFPRVTFQGKGLVATEAIVTLPLLPLVDPVLAIGSHLFEFESPASGDIFLAHETQKGEVYSVVVTTGGGLYRYRLGDLVEVTGSIGNTPTMRFLSRERFVSDHYGEKLNPVHVQEVIERTLRSVSPSPFFVLLAPTSRPGEKTFYTLFIDRELTDDREIICLRELIEKGLKENYHYEKCRQYGQLGALQLFFVDRTLCSPEEVFTREMARRGFKVGDIKPSVLDRETVWHELLPGKFLAAG